MQGISSKAFSFGSTENHKQFNGIEHTTDLDLNQYDAYYRTFDPQLGRFLQIDPKIESAESWSPYSGMLDNPIRYNDPLGDSSINPVAPQRSVGAGVCNGIMNFVESSLTPQIIPLAQAINGNPKPLINLLLPGTALLEKAIQFLKGDKQDKAQVGTELILTAATAVITDKVVGGNKSGFGDLTKSEVKQIQATVNQAGRPLEVVGSAAKGTRRGIGTDLPLGKELGTTRSDIDYIAPRSHLPYFMDIQKNLPSIDPAFGVTPGQINPFIGPGIRFEPNSKPASVPEVKN